MPISYEKAARTALRMLTENGRPVTLVKINRDPADPSLPWDGPGLKQHTTITAHAAFLDPVSEKDLGSMEKRGREGYTDNITRGMKIGFIAAQENLDANGNPVDLRQFDRLIDTDGRAYTMDEIHLLSPGGTELIYEVRVVR